MTPFLLKDRFIVLDSQQNAAGIDVSPSLYERLDREFEGFAQCALVAEYTFEGNWPTWERHPAGDEILVLLSGRMKLVLLEEGVERLVEFDTVGHAFIVPRGLWHTGRDCVAARVLFITPGEGTQNSVDPRNA